MLYCCNDGLRSWRRSRARSELRSRSCTWCRSSRR